MVVYLTNSTSVEDIKQAKADGVVAAKLYPVGASLIPIALCVIYKQ
jgi:dihydroorotase